MQNPEVTREGLLDIQVCVPEDWTDAQVEDISTTEVLSVLQNAVKRWMLKMVTLLSEDCDVRSEKICGESVLLCVTPKEKCQKQKYNPNVGVIVGEFSKRCIKV